ncbi:MAG: hypothetical protein GY862_03035, partial [Gammaproteobacteria bacterium]|nr:hypothetical protein [Gammaproteobacteria bacterium]
MTLCVLMLSAISVFGWGALFLRLPGLKFDENPFYTIACGLAFLIFSGGLLNDFSLVHPFVLNAILLAGIFISILFGMEIARKKKLSAKRLRHEFSFWKFGSGTFLKGAHYLLIFVVLLFLSTKLLPSSTFNHHDDLQKYMPRPVHMLQTGSLADSPFDATGVDSLGAQGFLHAFVINLAPITFLNVFDSVFCLILSALLLVDACKILKLKPFLPILPVFTLFLVNPQNVNVSSLYSGTLCVIALLISLEKLSEARQKRDFKIYLAHIVPAAMFFVALLCLKFTFIPFAFGYVFLYFILTAIQERNFSGMARDIVIFFTLTLIIIMPWLSLHLENYFQVLSLSGTQSEVKTGGTLFGGSLSAAFENARQLFSVTELRDGGTALSYTLCMLATLIFLLFAFITDRKTFSPAIAAACCTCFGIYFLYPFILPFDLGIRYIAPVLMAVFSISVILAVKTYGYAYFQKNRDKPPLGVCLKTRPESAPRRGNSRAKARTPDE